ncbi:zinc finger, CCHC-type containing protein [Tanacetum coccineum]|uniref:Zinc finger, CCHC-type containing protein n=1 Tax=Tanacetum coccineum TaxID=301880 RepID=A0ABQ5DP21_9ASTR
MTTSVVTNSVFRGFFEKQKLTGPNFIDWYRQLRIVLSVMDKLDYLEQPIPPAPVPAQAGQQVAPEALAAHAAWVKGSKEIAGIMLMTMEPEIQLDLENLRKTVNELHAMLKLHEQTQPKQNAPALHVIQAGKVQKKKNKQKPRFRARGQNQRKGKNKHAYDPKPKISPSPKKKNPAKDSVCHQCGDTGHWKRNCPQNLAELLKNMKLSQGASSSGIFTIELNTFLNRSWIYDTGCGTHICNTTQGLRASRKLKPGALSLYVGNGQREAVEAIGVFHLCLPSGLEIVLNNCHYAPSITRGVISVSRLYEDDNPKETMGYSFYYPPENKVLVARNAEFLENSLITQRSKDEPQSDIIPIRRSIRTRHAPDRMCLYIDDEEHELGDLGEPTNYKAALLDPESDKWLNAINVEIPSMKDNEVWDLVDLYPNGKTFGSKWLFKKKTDMMRANITSRFQQNPGDLHWTTVKNILKYLRNTKDMFLVYGEAEYIAAYDASKEAVWVRKFISGLGVVPTIEEPISMYCDNTGAITIANESGITKGARHFRAKVHYLREVIEFCDIKLEKVHTDDNLADPFTKALAFPKHSKHTKNIGMLPASSFMQICDD